MSFILEALRRAQDERSQTQPAAPRITTEEGQPVLRSVRTLPRNLQAALAGAGAAGVILLLAWMLWPATETENISPAQASVPAASVVAIAPEITQTVVSMDDLAETDFGAPATPAEEILSDLEAADAGEPAAAFDPPAGITEPATETAPEAPQTSIRTVELEAAPPSAVKTLREMPDDFRAAFPKIKIEVHAYDDDPAGRFVLIEGRRYREGEVLPQGPQLAAITADGVVFSFRNAEVLVPVGY